MAPQRCFLTAMFLALAGVSLSGSVAPGATKEILRESPTPAPLWATDLDQWLKEDPARKENRHIVGTGAGLDRGEATRRAFEAAVDKAAVPANQVGNLRVAATPRVVTFRDGSWEVTALFQWPGPAPAFACQEGIRRLCDDLLGQLTPEKKAKCKRVAVGRFTYKNTAFDSEFSSFLASELATALQQRAERGEVEIVDLPKAVPALAVIPQAMIEGNYWPPAAGENRAQVQAQMVEVGTGLMFGSASAVLLVGDVRAQMVPPDVEKAEGTMKTIEALREKIKIVPDGRQNFKVSLWLEQGRRVWKHGQKLVVHFQSERDCHLNLFHLSSDGSVELLFPNRWHADDFVPAGRDQRIPSEAMKFDLVIAPPYGTDILMAVAVSKQNPKLLRTDAAREGAVSSVAGGAGGIVAKLKDAFAALPGDEKAEALVTYTTAP